ncbi:MAG: gluconate 2-dehydrogenase subunit 3 family protein [Clostridia bacterium]
MANRIDHNEDSTLSRRKFLQNAGYAVGGLIVGGIAGSFFPSSAPQKTPPPAPATEPTSYTQALMFFTQEQFKIVEAATERIFPQDELGPGAKALGVAYFIDHQLAGDWGFNARDYMQAPFFKGEKVQGYQGRLKRRELFDIGLREMQNYSNATYKKNFPDLTPEEQDAVLKVFEDGKINLSTISETGFFNLLRASTMEGVYADPLYGGNKNMDGWKLKSFPGNQMAYTQVIEQDAFTKIEPKSLKDHLAH